jgi:MFS superfamily sulfate permease-like transporter
MGGPSARSQARFPVSTSFRGYQAGWLRGDAAAGLFVWAVPVPEALAYAAATGRDRQVRNMVAAVSESGALPE